MSESCFQAPELSLDTPTRFVYDGRPPLESGIHHDWPPRPVT